MVFPTQEQVAVLSRSIEKLRSLGVEDLGRRVRGPSTAGSVSRVPFGLHDDAASQTCCTCCTSCTIPNVSNRIEEGHLTQLLTKALPPLDDRFVDDATVRLDDLEQVKQQVSCR